MFCGLLVVNMFSSDEGSQSEVVLVGKKKQNDNLGVLARILQ